MKVILLISILCSLIPSLVIAEPFTWWSVKYVGLHRQEHVMSRIVTLAREYEVNEDTALRIARCESNYNPLAENNMSSASGVYQFIDGTWEHYCEGDVLDAEDNITCFMQLYNKNPTWWECK